MKLTQLSEIGEFGLIKKITENVKLKHPSSIFGIGDDAAVLEYPNKQIVVTTDMLVENVHFNLMYTPLKHLGYKAVVVNLSDVFAMNAIPRQITVSMAMSSRFTVEAVEELYAGIHLACEKYGIDLIGGDTSASQKGLIISVTAIGEANPHEIVYRNGAKLNDLICVSGDLGAAYMGLQLLEREKEIFKSNPNMQPDFSGNDYILERQLKPEARGDIIQELLKLEIKPTSMIDISDGLSSELLHICEESNVGCKIYENKIPIAYETKKMSDEFGLAETICALNGGEDYELLFTVPVALFEKIKDNEYFKIIGHICDASDGKYLITKDNLALPLEAHGWNAMIDAPAVEEN